MTASALSLVVWSDYYGIVAVHNLFTIKNRIFY